MSLIPDPWYALSVKHHHEKAVAAALRGKGFVEFLPLYERRYRSAGRLRTTQLPLFPTYLFCRLDPTHRLPVMTIPGVWGIVGRGNTPEAVSNEEVEAIQAVTQCGRHFCPWEERISAGDAVMIEHGPLKGVRGVVVTADDGWRLVVSVTLLQRAVSVDIDRGWVRSDRWGAPPLRAPAGETAHRRG
jgi:transcription termination/antitermination protein NusG